MKSKKTKLSSIDKYDINISKFAKILIVLIMLVIPTIQFIRMQSLFSGNTNVYDKLNVSYVIYISLPFLILTYVYKIFRDMYKIGIKDYILYGLMILAVISTIGAADVKTSLYGLGDRFEGLFAIIFYYLLMLVSSTINEWKFKKDFINVFIGIGIIQTIYAFFQVIVRPMWVLGFVLPYMGNAFCGNPNFFGNFIAMCLLLSIGCYLFGSKGKIFYFLCTVLFSIGIVLANSFGPLTGILVASIVLLGITWKKYKENLKKCFMILAVSAMTILIGAYGIDNYCTEKFNDVTMPGYTLRSDFDEILGVLFNKNQETNQIVGQIDNVGESNPISMVNGRSMVWGNALGLVKDHFWFGAGLDNFATVYQQKYGMYIDKAHNIYLNILVTNGIFALVGYVGLIIYVLIKSFKNLTDMTIILLGAVICYVVQAFFSINVLVVAPYFYITIGLMLGLVELKNSNIKRK